jgi:hypothetical protein
MAKVTADFLETMEPSTIYVSDAVCTCRKSSDDTTSSSPGGHLLIPWGRGDCPHGTVSSSPGVGLLIVPWWPSPRPLAGIRLLVPPWLPQSVTTTNAILQHCQWYKWISIVSDVMVDYWITNMTTCADFDAVVASASQRWLATIGSSETCNQLLF